MFQGGLPSLRLSLTSATFHFMGNVLLLGCELWCSGLAPGVSVSLEPPPSRSTKHSNPTDTLNDKSDNRVRFLFALVFNIELSLHFPNYMVS